VARESQFGHACFKSSNKIVDNERVGSDLEGDRRGLFKLIVLAFAWRN
jgi:hypothetical protein